MTDPAVLAANRAVSLGGAFDLIRLSHQRAILAGSALLNGIDPSLDNGIDVQCKALQELHAAAAHLAEAAYIVACLIETGEGTHDARNVDRAPVAARHPA